MSQTYNFPTRCRTCLESKSGQDSLNKIVSVYGEDLSLSDVIFSCTGLHVGGQDKKPQTICLECSSNVISFYTFRTNCIKSDLILQNEFDFEVEKCSTEFVLDGVSVDNSSDSEIEYIDPDDEINKTNNDSDVEEIIEPSSSRANIETVTNPSELSKIFPCGLCDESFYEARKLHLHLQQTHQRLHTLPPEIKVCQCKLCGHLCYSIKTIMVHLKSHADNCDLVPVDTLNSNLLQFKNGMGVDADMLKQVASLEKSERDITRRLDRTETILGGLASEQTIHEFKCTVCGESFTRRYCLFKHMNTYHGENACPTCDAKFVENIQLLNHVKRAHKVREKRHMCDLCGKAFADLRNMRRHRRIHTGEKPYGCTICDAKFSEASSLRYHMQTHTDVREFVCDICGYASRFKFTLTQHMLAHSEEPTIKCTVCEKMFKTKQRMRRHVVTCHVNERQFACETCGKGFNTNFTLEVHRRTHTGEKPYPCTLCHLRFSQPSVLKTHMKKHQNDQACVLKVYRGFTG